MGPLRNSRRRAAVTLIELLCTIAIILVLAGLVIAPAGRVIRRVRADAWDEKVNVRLQAAVDQLRRHLMAEPAFGLLTLDRIESNRWVGPLEMDFLRDSRVTFTPFSPSDPDTKVVVQVRIERGFWTDAGFQTRVKQDLTSEPK